MIDPKVLDELEANSATVRMMLGAGKDVGVHVHPDKLDALLAAARDAERLRAKLRVAERMLDYIEDELGPAPDDIMADARAAALSRDGGG